MKIYFIIDKVSKLYYNYRWACATSNKIARLFNSKTALSNHLVSVKYPSTAIIVELDISNGEATHIEFNEYKSKIGKR